jgi:tetratricopeptide (TPR) repeat protein
VQKARPNSPEVNHFLGRALLVKGSNLGEAQRYLKLAAEGDRNRAEYHLYYGWVANEVGQPQVAEEELQRALDLDKNLGDAYWQRGVLRQKRGQSVDALADLRTALEKRPSRFEAYATMALCFQEQQKFAEAENAWRKAIAGDGNVAEWHYRLGKLYADGGNRGGSAPELAKAIELGDVPDRPPPSWLFDAHMLYGEAIRGSDRAKAILSYRRFLELAPRDNAYRKEKEKELEALGVPVQR